MPGEIDDDMAVVVVRTSAVDLASWEGQFPAEPIRVSEARRLAHETFTSWGMDIEQADLACLLVSEVVTNVVLHAAVSPTPRHELVLEGAGSGPLGILGDWELSPFEEGFGRPRRQGLHAPAAARPRGHLGRGIRRRPAAARIRSAGESDEGGRGLYLVDQLATPVGLTADQGRQGGLVRDADQGRPRPEPALTASAARRRFCGRRQCAGGPDRKHADDERRP